ncbi:MAG: hypothetical protein K2Y32_05060 [Candidatus Obscuribacterales bacterium]|nr:hypothetical protein [Candidatus Obscuribacterales bacterium]
MDFTNYQSTKDQVAFGEKTGDKFSASSSMFADAMNGAQVKKILCDKFGCEPSLPPIVIEPKPRDTCVERANGEIACGTEISPESIRGGKGKIDFPNPDFIKPDVTKPEQVKPEFIKPESVKPDFVKPVPEKPGSGDDQGEGGGKGKPKNPEECRDVGYLLSNPPIAVCLDDMNSGDGKKPSSRIGSERWGGNEKEQSGSQKDKIKTLPSGKGFIKLPGLVLE